MALLSLPFLAVTVERLLKDDPVLLQLSRTAAVATLIYVPFALVPILRDALISTVVSQAFLLITALGHHPQLLAWDILYENRFANQIIPGCTGLMAIAILLGVALGVEKFSLRQVLAALFLVVPTIGILNLLRGSVSSSSRYPTRGLRPSPTPARLLPAVRTSSGRTTSLPRRLRFLCSLRWWGDCAGSSPGLRSLPGSW